MYKFVYVHKAREKEYKLLTIMPTNHLCPAYTQYSPLSTSIWAARMRVCMCGEKFSDCQKITLNKTSILIILRDSVRINSNKVLYALIKFYIFNPTLRCAVVRTRTYPTFLQWMDGWWANN